MSDPVARPTFYEGEILPAADLVATVNYSRDQMARHGRYLHSWGIAFGLDLQGTPAKTATGAAYKTVTLMAGMAIDGRGREIVVPDDVLLNPNDFTQHVKPLTDPNAWYPVFLSGRDENAAAPSLLTGACGSSMPTRTKENYDVTYGMPGTELNLDQQQPAAVAEGPGDGVTTDPWKVLLGFVQWSQTVPQFADVADVSPDSGVRRRYADVYAEGVVSHNGFLRLATHPTDFKGQTAVMAVEIHEEKNGELIFGKQNPDGTITPALTVSARGDITTQGQIRGALATGGVQVESGLATHGMILPLPPGVTEDQVASGDALVQTLVSVHLDGTENPDPAVAGASWGAFPLECFVDAQRQVHCKVRWFQVAPPPVGTNIEDKPGVCQYLVVVATKPK